MILTNISKNTPELDRRAATSTVGVALLTTIVVIAVSLGGIAFLGLISGDESATFEEAKLDFQADTFTLTPNVAEDLDTEDTELHLTVERDGVEVKNLVVEDASQATHADASTLGNVVSHSVSEDNQHLVSGDPEVETVNSQIADTDADWENGQPLSLDLSSDYFQPGDIVEVQIVDTNSDTIAYDVRTHVNELPLTTFLSNGEQPSEVPRDIRDSPGFEDRDLSGGTIILDLGEDPSENETNDPGEDPDPVPDVDFLIDIIETDSPVEAGEELTAQVRVESLNETHEDSETVVLENPEGVPVDIEEDVTLEPEESTIIELTWGSTHGYEGTETIRATGEEHVDEREVEIKEGEEEGPYFEVSFRQQRGFDLWLGESERNSVSVSEQNGVEGTQLVVVEDYNGEIIDAEQIRLSADSTRGMRFFWEPEETGEGELTAYSPQDSDSVPAEVSEPEMTGIEIQGAPNVMEDGDEDSIEVEAEYEDGETETVTGLSNLSASTESDDSSLTIDESGELQASAEDDTADDAEIEAELNSLSDTASLIVTDDDSGNGGGIPSYSGSTDLTSTMTVGETESFGDVEITIDSTGNTYSDSEFISMSDDEHPFPDAPSSIDHTGTRGPGSVSVSTGSSLDSVTAEGSGHVDIVWSPDTGNLGLTERVDIQPDDGGEPD